MTGQFWDCCPEVLEPGTRGSRAGCYTPWQEGVSILSKVCRFVQWLSAPPLYMSQCPGHSPTSKELPKGRPIPAPCSQCQELGWDFEQPAGSSSAWGWMGVPEPSLGMH